MFENFLKRIEPKDRKGNTKHFMYIIINGTYYSYIKVSEKEAEN